MTEDLEKTQRQEKNARKVASVFLFAAMALMALWGWTPLKKVIPGTPVLVLFMVFVVLSVILTLLSIYRGIQARSKKAQLEDQ